MKPIVYIVLVADSFRSDAAYQIEGVFASLEAVESFVTTELEGVADYIDRGATRCPTLRARISPAEA